MSDSHNTLFHSSRTAIPNPRRKRGRVACDYCHSRKVRCDLTLNGVPCTNCRLDKRKCFAWKPRNKLQKKHTSKAPTSEAHHNTTATVTFPDPRLGVSCDFPLPPISLSSTHGASFLYEDEDEDSTRGLLLRDRPSDRIPDYPSLRQNGSSASPPCFSVPSMLGETASDSSRRISDKKLKALPNLLSVDVTYLESKGCFRVPSDSYLDAFMLEYFLHVHPCVPILNEADFWNLYGHKDGMLGASKVSLLVFQAMLFAASAFVPLRTLQACGFRDSHEARETLHQRAALLYQFKAEPNLACIAQASLLLSFHSSARDVYNNTSFLSIAIQCARADRAHLYSVIPKISPRERRDKKRLWWCCFVRDRVIALGMRRPLQITPDQFDYRREPFEEEDIKCEVGQSRVYDPETKRSLIKIFVAQCELAAALTSTLLATYPLDRISMSLSHTSTDLMGLSSVVQSCRQDLNAWFDATEARLKHNSGKDVLGVDFVTLYTDLLWIYYFTARMALCHFIIYISSMCRTRNPDWMSQSNISNSDLKSAFTGLKDVFKRLVASNLAGHLPISASAYTALPLLLVSLDVWLSSSEYQKKRHMQDLSHCAEAMRQYERRFSFAKFVTEIVRKVVQLVDHESLSKPRSPINNISGLSGLAAPTPNHPPRSWSETYSQNPQLYFKLLFSLDHFLSYGNVPSPGEPPDWFLGQSPPQPNKPLEATDQENGDLEPLTMSRAFSPDLFGRSVPSKCPSNEQRETFQSIAPSLSPPVYPETSPQPEHEHTTAGSQSNLSSLFSDDTNTHFNDIGVDAGDAQPMFDTLSFLLQYSCPSIG
ncbi:transcription factor domain-containing protein [Aspergillus alliaceus]|uniref:transcription factor domain-containing protein n=1 Tax=Petromyces alliaceus TaxID=209559 RepID=UPI0012A3FB6C|nr:fungal-specific transcription factor domain-containing protein [Aspergillus alliaceus]KAB8238954.1 fungal-specific transcription factor domain-containing protein [Aspergillus alliaceus]